MSNHNTVQELTELVKEIEARLTGLDGWWHSALYATNEEAKAAARMEFALHLAVDVLKDKVPLGADIIGVEDGEKVYRFTG